MGRRTKECPSFVEIDGDFLTKPIEIANYFNVFFKGKVDKLTKGMNPVDGSKSYAVIRNEIMTEKNCEFDFRQISVIEVEKLLKSLSVDKPSGTDNLDGKLLNITANIVASPICHILNRCLASGLCPESWKEAKILPIPKDIKAVFNGPNSRPISILPVISKLMEKIVYVQIQEYFEKNNLTTMFQHAYRKNHSTCTAMAQMTNDWLKEMDNSNLVGAILLDFSAAFDIIDHNLLIGKLRCYGLKPSAIAWLESYLSNRRQRVFYNGVLSNTIHLNCGVPQGSCLGPLLFSIFTNDLPSVINKASLTLYADDSTLYYAASSIKELNQVLSKELDLVYEWVTCNRLVLNVSKTKGMVFGTRHGLAKDPQLDLKVAQEPVQQVTKTKLLGVTLDNSLSWTDHIDRIVTNMGRGTAVIRRCSYYLPSYVMNKVIQSLVLSHLDYCPVIWSSASKKDIVKLQFAQNRAARLALGCTKRTNVASMHSCLSWFYVEKRISFRLVVFIRNIINSQSPIYLANQLVHREDIHKHNTRASRHKFDLPLPRTNLLKKSIMYRAISYWNNLPSHIYSQSSLPK